MSSANDHLQTLKEALALSPENARLRQHVGDLCLQRGLLDDAEAIFREGVTRSPQDVGIKLGLARCFHQQGKHTAAIVVVEELLGKAPADGRVHLLHAKLLMHDGEIDRAAQAYRRAIDLDPQLADEHLAEALGVRPFEQDEQGRQRVPAQGQPMEAEAVSASDQPIAELERPRIDFDSVGGMNAVKEQIRLKIIAPLQQPEIYKAYGKPIGGGILMYGPPGCGKTHLARATAGQVKAAFINVAIHDVLDMWLGSSEQKLHGLFEQARQNKPCVLFFDEVDALGASRADLRQTASKHLINQFLSELDGINSANEGVLVLAATNAPWHLDPAFRRPGRFDRILFIPPPDAPARAEILRVMLRGKPQDAIDVDSIAKKLADYSGADLKALVDSAIELKLDDALRTGKPQPLTTRDLLAAAKTLKPTTKAWFNSARNYALYANDDGLYDDILAHLNIKK